MLALTLAAFAGPIALPTTPLVFDLPDTFVVRPGTVEITDLRGTALSRSPSAGEFPPGKPVQSRRAKIVALDSSASYISATIRNGDREYEVYVNFDPAVNDARSLERAIRKVKVARTTAPIEYPWRVGDAPGFTDPVGLPGLFGGFGYSAFASGTWAVMLPDGGRGLDRTNYMSTSIHLGLGHPELHTLERSYLYVYATRELVDEGQDFRWFRVSDARSGHPDGYLGARRVRLPNGREASHLILVPAGPGEEEAQRARRVFDSLEPNPAFAELVERFEARSQAVENLPD
jgi:hypothetical protein